MAPLLSGQAVSCVFIGGTLQSCPCTATTTSFSNLNSQLISIIAANAFSTCTAVTGTLYLYFSQIWNIASGAFTGLSAVTTLDLSYNLIGGIASGIFTGLSKLATLSLIGNQISSIASGGFTGLSALTSLDLSYNMIVGIASGIFTGLSKLATLSLYRNQISSIASGGFTGLSALTSLDLSYNQITSLPSGAFTGLPALASLTLCGNRITQIVSGTFTGLSTLTFLDLSSNTISSLASGAFSGLAALTSLWLHANLMGSIATGILTSLSALRSLSLTSNQIANIASGAFTGMSELTSLLLNDNRITQIVSGTFTGLSTLQSLDMSYNQISTIASNAFTGLPALTTLSLPFNQITSFGNGTFAGLSALSSLSVLSNKITSVPSGAFSGMLAVTSLYLSSNRITIIATDAFAGLSKLTSLTLYSNQISSIASGTFTGLSALTILSLYSNRIASIASDTFTGLSALTTLSLSFNQISSIASGTFTGLTALASLSLSSNQISSIASGTFTGLTALASLSLYSNQISSIASGTFTGLTALASLSLSSNLITSLASGTFTGLSALTSLDLSSNRIASIANDTFTGLPALASLYLSSNPSTCVASSLTGLSSALQLTVSCNQFASCPVASLMGIRAMYNMALNFTVDSQCAVVGTNSFAPFSAVTTLDLANKYITALASGAFSGLSALTTLALSSNHITAVHPRAFVGLSQLTYLSLQNNPLLRLPGAALQPLTRLKQLYLMISAPYFDRFTFYGLSPTSLSLGGTQTSSFCAAAGGQMLSLNGLSYCAMTDAVGVLQPGTQLISFSCQPKHDTLVLPAGATAPILSSCSGCQYLSRMVLSSKQISSIRPAFFAGMTELYLLDLSKNALTRIEANSFANLTNLNSLDLSFNQLTSLTAGTFTGLSLLTRLSLFSNQISSIAGDEFMGLTALTTLLLYSNQITSIASNAFAGLSALTTLSLYSNHLSNIAVGAFTGLSALTTLDLQFNKITSIATGAFTGLIALTSLSLNSNQISNIAAGAFTGLSALTTLDLQFNKITSIATGAFTGLSALSSLSLSSNQISSIAAGAFTGLSALTTLSLNSNLITGIATGAFTGLSALSSLSLSSNQISSIAAGAFTGLSALTSLDLQWNKITSIASGAFNGMSALTTLSLTSNQISSIASGTFTGLSALTTLSLSSNLISSIASGTFTGLSALASLSLHYNQISSIANGTFTGLSALTTLILHSSLIRSIASGAFTGLSKLTSLPLYSNQISSIASGAFTGLTALTTLFLNSNQINSIASGTFTGLSALTALFLNSNQISSIASGTFTGLSALTTLSLYSNRITSIASNAFAGLSALTTLSLYSNQVSSIASGAFTGLSALTSLDLYSNQITTIANGTFSELSVLTSLSLYNNLIATLTRGAFIGLTQLTSLLLYSNPIASCAAGSFAGLSTTLVLGVSCNQFASCSNLLLPEIRSLVVQTVCPVLGSNSFAPFVAVTSLDLRGRSVGTIANGAFTGLSALTTLFLASNQIASIASGTFTGLSKLTFLYQDISTNPITTLPRDVFSSLPNAASFRLTSSMTTATCTTASGVWTSLGTNLKFCAKADCVGTFSAQTVSWQCASNHDRLAIPSNALSTVVVGTTAGCSIVNAVDFSARKISIVQSAFLDSLPNLISLKLPNNQLTSFPAFSLALLTELDLRSNLLPSLPLGFCSTIKAVAIVRLASNNFPAACEASGFSSQYAPGTNDLYCEEPFSASLFLTRGPASDTVTLSWSRAASAFVSSTYSCQFGTSPAISGTSTSTSITFLHSAMPANADGQLASVTVQPRFDCSGSLPMTLQWTLSFSPPTVALLSAITHQSRQTSITVIFRCSKFGCTFTPVFDASVLPTIRQAAATGLSFAGRTADSIAAPLAWPSASAIPALPSVPLLYRLDGTDHLVTSGSAFPELPTLLYGRHEMHIWSTDAQGARQPCPLGIWWWWLPIAPASPTLQFVIGGWIGMSTSDLSIASWKGCYAASAGCADAVLMVPALQLLPGSFNVRAAVINVASQASAATAVQLNYVPRPAVDSWELQAVQVAPQSGFVLNSRLGFGSAWRNTASPTPSRSRSSLLQLRWSDTSSRTGDVLTVAAVFDATCVSSIALVPRATTCSAPTGQYCRDEIVFGVVQSNCTAPIDVSTDLGLTWKSIAVQVGMVSAPPPSSSITVRQYSRVLTSVSWVRSPMLATSLQIQFSCKPDARSTESVARFCVQVSGWLPPSVTVQYLNDGNSWQTLDNSVFVIPGLLPGQHTVRARMLDSSISAVLDTTEFTWTVVAGNKAPWLAWTSVPPALSWAAADTISWCSPEVGIADYQVLVSGVWQPTNATSWKIAGSPNAYDYRCFSVRGVSGSGIIGSPLQYCWWSHQQWLSVMPAISNGGADHGVFDQTKPLLMIWKPMIAESGVQSLRYAVSPVCSNSGVTWVPTSNWLVTVSSLTAGWQYVLVQGVGAGSIIGPLACRRIYVTTTAVPKVMFTQTPSLISTESLTNFAFTNSTPTLTSMYWFECFMTDVWRRCLSPLPIGPLLPGNYTLKVRSNDASNVPSTAVSYSWTIRASDTSSITLSNLADGPHTLSLTPYDDVGKGGNTLTATWIVDTAAPVLVSASAVPSPICFGATCFTGQLYIQIRWSATDLPRNAACSDCSVQLSTQYCTSAAVCTTSVSTNTTLSLSREGQYGVTVQPVDPAGNVGTGSVIRFVVDHTRPTTQILSPASGYATRSRNVTVIMRSEAWSSAALSLDLVVCWSSASPSSTGVHTASVSLAGLPDGRHTLVATSVDGAGNRDVQGAALNLTLDTTPPSTHASLVLPLLSHGVTNHISAQVAVWGTDATTSIASWQVTHQPPTGVSVVSSATNSSGWAVSNLPAGLHSVRVQAIDLVGNMDPVGVTLSWVVDLSAPSTTLAVVRQSVTNSTAISLVLGGQDNTGIGRWVIDHTGPTASFASVSTSPKLVVSSMSQGRHSIRAAAIDWGGNQDPVGASVAVTVDLTPPSTTALLVSPSTSSLSAVSITLGGTDAITSVVGWQLAHHGPAATVPSYVTASSISVTGMAEGLHQLTAYAVDAVGRVDPLGATVAWRIDRTAPYTVVQLQGPTPTTNTSMLLRLSGVDEATAITSWSLQYVGPGCVMPSSSMAPQVLVSGCTAGVHAVTARAVDTAGNQDPTGARISWIVDLTPPYSSSIRLVDGTPTPTSSVAFVVSGRDALTSVVAWRVAHEGPAVVSLPSPVTSNFTASGFAEGRHTLHVFAIDTVGWEDPIGAAVSVTVDLTPPATTAVLTVANPSNSTAATILLGGHDNTTAVANWKLSHIGAAAASVPTLVHQPAATVTGLAEGYHDIWVQAIDQVGNTDPVGVHVRWLVDLTPPRTGAALMTRTPTNQSYVDLQLSGNDTWSPVLGWYVSHSELATPIFSTMPTLQVTLVAEGVHVITARAVDAAWNVDPAGRSVSLVIDRTPPSTSVSVRSVNPTNVTTVDLLLGGHDSVTSVRSWSIVADTQQHLARNSMMALTDLPEGRSIIRAYGIDDAGNQDPAGASVPVTVDLTPPSTTAVLVSPPISNFTSVSITLGGTDAITSVVGWQLVHRGPAAAMPSYVTSTSIAVVAMAEGRHQLTAYAVDAVVRVDPVGATVEWLIDRTPPDTIVRQRGTTPTPSRTMVLELGGTSDTCAWALSYVSGPGCVLSAWTKFTTVTATNCLEGSHTVRVFAIDAAGNQDPTGAATTWTVDWTVPTTAIHLLGASITNSSSASLLLGGVDVVTSVVAWHVNHTTPGGQVLASRVVSSLLHLDELVEGMHCVNASAEDAAGNVDVVGAGTCWLVDRTAPKTTAQLQSPAISSSTTIRVLLSGSDAQGSGIRSWHAVMGRQSAVHYHDQPLLTIVAPADGVHELWVRATDAAGNEDIVGTRVTIKTDTTPPMSRVSLAGSNPTAAVDMDILLDGADVTTLVDHWLVKHTGPGGSIAANVRNTGLPTASQFAAGLEGTHAITAQAVDAVGNVDPAGASVSWLIDLTPPHTTVAMLTPNVSNTPIVALELSGSDAITSVRGWSVQHDGPAGSVSSFVAGHQFVQSQLADGEHHITVRAVDAVNHTDPIGQSVSWITDTVAPNSTIQLQFASPVAGRQGTARLMGIDATTRVEYWLVRHTGPAAVLDNRVVAVHNTQDLVLQDMQDGVHNLFVQAVDSAGNIQALPTSVSWIVDTTPPLTTAGLLSSTPSASTTMELALGGHDDTTAISHWLISHSGPTASFESRIPAPANTCRFLALGEGTHVAVVRAVDAAGNVDARGASVTWVVDLSPPESGSALQGPNPTSARQVTILLSGADNTTRVDYWQISHTGAGATVPTRVTASVDTTGVLVCSDLQEGQHTVVAQAVDMVGRLDVAGTTIVFTVDFTPPTSSLQLLSASSIVPTPAASIRVQGTDSVTRVVRWSVQHSGPGAAMTWPAVVWADQQGVGLVSVTQAGEGLHTIRVVAEDAAGNQQFTATALTWTVDLTPPTTGISCARVRAVSNVTTTSMELSGTDATTSVVDWELVHAGPSATVTVPTFGSALLTHLKEGTHRLTAFAIDAAGNRDTVGASCEWVVDVIAPQTFVQLDGPNVTASTTVTMSVLGLDATTSVRSWAVHFSGSSGSAFVLSRTSSVSHTATRDGQHYASVFSIDGAGNQDPKGALVTWTVDTTPPTTAADLLSAAISSADSALIALHGQDVTTTVHGWQIAHQTPSGRVSSSSTSDTLLRLIGLNEQGKHIVVAKAFDVVSNTDPRGATLSWVVDYTPPSTNATMLATTPTSHDTVSIALGATDAFTTVTRWTVQHVGPSAVVPFTVQANSSSTSIQVTGCAEGHHRLSVFAIDAAGNQDPIGANVSWIADFTPPQSTITLLGPSLTNVTSIRAQVTGTDALTHIVAWQMTHVLPDKGAAAARWTSTVPLVQVTQCQDGQHVLRAQAVDQAGLVDPAGAEVTFQVDTRPPVTTFLQYPAALSNSSTVVVQAQCSEPECVIYIQLDNQPALQTASGQLVVFSNVTDGQHQVTLTSLDAAGNAQVRATVGLPFVIDTKPVAVASVEFDDLDAVGNQLTTAKSEVRLRFLQQDADNRPCWSCKIVLRGADVGVGPQGIIRFVLDTDGVTTLQPVSIDAAGNTLKLPPMTILRDTKPPRTTVVAWNVAHNGFSNATVLELSLTSTKPHQTVFHMTGAVSGRTTRDELDPVVVRLSGFADGLKCIAIQAEDVAHNLETEPVPWCWTVDTVPPISTWQQPPAALIGTSLISGLLVQPETGTVVRMFARNASDRTVSTVCQKRSCAVNVTNDGSWSVWLESVDHAGNAERLPQSRTVVVDTIAPLLAWTTPQPEGVSVKVSDWTATIVTTDASKVLVTATCTSIDTGAAVPVSVIGSQLRVKGLTDGAWRVVVKAVDEAGHASVDLVHGWTVDLTAPSISRLTLPHPVLNVSGSVPVYNKLPICLQVECQDALSGCSIGYGVTLTQRFVSASCGTQTGSAQAGSRVISPAPSGRACIDQALDGVHVIDLQVTDGVGNVFEKSDAFSFALDTVGPAAPEVSVPGIVNQQTKEAKLLATVVLSGDPSPLQDRMQLWYRLDLNAAAQLSQVSRAVTDTGVRHSTSLSLTHMRDGQHVLKVWAIDAAGNVGVDWTYQWTIQSAAPETVIGHAPASDKDIGLLAWEFQVRGIPIASNASGAAAAPIAGLQVKLDSQEWRDVCGGNIGTAVCPVQIVVTTVGSHTLLARATNTLGVTDGEPDMVQWTVKQCADTQVSNIDALTGVIRCDPCPAGGNCMGGRAAPSEVVARQGYWASAQSSTFYDCPLENACMGGNGTVRAVCAPGYTGVLCSLCAPNYYLQFGQCLECPKDTTSAWFYMIGGGVLLLVLAGVAAAVQKYLPQTVMKIGLAMVQIIGNANTAFAAPWPATFVSLLTGMKVFMLEILTLTRTSCAAPATFYTSFNVNVFGMTGITIALAAALIARAQVQSRKRAQAWSIGQILKPLFMFWLLCYPAVSLKLFQLFKCLDVEGTPLLRADMRLVCYDSTWWTYAGISIAYLLVFTTGLPVAIMVYLFHRRHELDHAAVIGEAGFLYLQYGPQAYAWEAVELVRKLILTCVLTLLDPASPLPLTLAVLVSALAQVMHAAYKPFVHRKYYYLQHGSLTCTLLVFVIGLMFKVKSSGIAATALTVILVGTCAVTIAALLAVALVDIGQTIRQVQRAKLVAVGKGARATRSGGEKSPASNVSAEEVAAFGITPLKNPLRKQQSADFPVPTVDLSGLSIQYLSNPLHDRSSDTAAKPAATSSVPSGSSFRNSFRRLRPGSSSKPVASPAAETSGYVSNPLHSRKRLSISRPVKALGRQSRAFVPETSQAVD